MPTIVPFTTSEIEAALALWRVTDHLGLTPEDEPVALDNFLARNPGLSYVAVDDGRVVGTVLCGHDGRRGYIHHIAVAAAYRRRSLASELLDRALAKLQSNGIAKCHALVFRDNPYGELFWSRKGWEFREDIWVYSKRV